MKMDYYSGVTGMHYISEEYKRQGELNYFADLEKKKIKEIQKLNNQNIYINESIIAEPTQNLNIHSKQDLKKLLNNRLYEIETELHEHEADLKFIKKYEKLNKQLKQLRKQGFFKYLFNAGPLQREIANLSKSYKNANLLLNDIIYEDIKQDLPVCIQGLKAERKQLLDILNTIKESN